MGTTLGEGIDQVAAELAAIKGIAVYVTVASVVSATLGVLVLPRLFHSGSAGPACPPCECLCASTCVPAPAGATP